MKFVIPNIFFVIALGILMTIVTLLSSKGNLFNRSDTIIRIFRREFRFSEGLTRNGRIVLVWFIITICVLAIQEWNANSMQHNSDLKIELNQKKNEIELTRKVDSIQKNYFDLMAGSLANHGLKIDSLTGVIKNIRDSVQTVNNYRIETEDPVLHINTTNGIKYKNGYYRLDLHSMYAPSTNFSLSVKSMVNLKDGRNSFRELPIPNELTIYKAQPLSLPITFEVDSSAVKTILIYVSGGYSNSSKTLDYSFEWLLEYNQSTRVSWGITGEQKTKILEDLGW